MIAQLTDSKTFKLIAQLNRPHDTKVKFTRDSSCPALADTTILYAVAVSTIVIVTDSLYDALPPTRLKKGGAYPKTDVRIRMDGPGINSPG